MRKQNLIKRLTSRNTLGKEVGFIHPVFNTLRLSTGGCKQNTYFVDIREKM